MSINHTALVTKIGKIFGGLNETNTYRGSTFITRVAALRTAYAPDADEVLTDLTTVAQTNQAALNGWVSYSTSLVGTTILATVNDDRIVPYTDLDSALTEWVRQLQNDAQTFNDCPVTITHITTGTPSPTADYAFVITDKDGRGVPTNFGVPDRYLWTVLLDADRGGTRWAETLGITGKAVDALPTDASYPTGTGINTSVTVTDPQVSGGVLADGSFNNYSGGLFASWTRGAGLTSTDVSQAAIDYRFGSAGFSLDLKSAGNLPLVTQTVTPSAATPYAINFAVKCVNATDAGAKVWVTLRNATTNAIVTDAQGVAFTAVSTTMGTIGAGNWVRFTAKLVTPYYLPSGGVYVEIRLANGTTITTPATAATEALVDHVSITPMPELYTGGPRIVVYSGIILPLLTDQWQTTVALASGSIGDYIIRWMDRTIGLATRGMIFPTIAGGTETLPDSLIT